MTCDITNIDALSRATIETYLKKKKQKLTNNKFNELSELPDNSLNLRKITPWRNFPPSKFSGGEIT